MKNKLVVIIVVIAALFVLGVVKDQAIKTIATVQVSNITGAKAHIGSFSLGLLNQRVKINDFKIFNPAGFPKGVLLDIGKIHVNYDLAGILKGKLHLPEVKVDLKEVVVIKDKEGKLNVDSLKVAKKEGAKETKPAKAMEMAIDTLNLSIGKVVLKDYSHGEGKFWVEVYDIGIQNRVYKNIASAQQFISLILVESMKPTAIKSAAIYGAASLAGMSLFPLTAAVLFTGKDYSEATLKANYQRVFRAASRAFAQMGNAKNSNEELGHLEGEIGGAQVIVKIQKKSGRETNINISARELMFPKPTLAAGVLYQIEENLKN
ncbi:MAG: hypothetical protein PHG68_02945 [Candidatus Omnitrophica bacterium]|nr:hypothetical protein [Candidatus Omnitrophota bacterium]